jgi:hypothetical protein
MNLNIISGWILARIFSAQISRYIWEDHKFISLLDGLAGGGSEKGGRSGMNKEDGNGDGREDG